MSGATSAMRGLSVFIADIRSSANKEAERARVDKELANIRTKFKSEKQLTGTWSTTIARSVHVHNMEQHQKTTSSQRQYTVLCITYTVRRRRRSAAARI